MQGIFGRRSDAVDYSKGLFYASRVQLFRKDNKVLPSETPEPLIRTKSIMKPIEFEKEQEELSRTLSNRPFANILKVKAKAEITERTTDKEKESKLSAFRLAAKKIISNIVIFHPEDTWNLEEHGGIKMWVNAKSGEVSIENPNLISRSNLRRRASLQKRGSIQGRRESVSLRRSSTSIKRRGSDYHSSNKELQDMYELLNPKSMLRLTVLEKEQ